MPSRIHVYSAGMAGATRTVNLATHATQPRIHVYSQARDHLGRVLPSAITKSVSQKMITKPTFFAPQKTERPTPFHSFLKSAMAGRKARVTSHMIPQGDLPNMQTASPGTAAKESQREEISEANRKTNLCTTSLKISWCRTKKAKKLSSQRTEIFAGKAVEQVGYWVEVDSRTGDTCK